MDADVPANMERYSRGPLRLLGWGVPLGPLRLLRTHAPRTGRAHVVPVAVLRHRGREWLVSPFGTTRWVRDVRASGTAELGRGHDYRPVDLTEIDDRVKIGVCGPTGAGSGWCRSSGGRSRRTPATRPRSTRPNAIATRCSSSTADRRRASRASRVDS